MRPGIIYLIGAGPGDPGLISEKALHILRAADCIIYDYLSNPQLIEDLKCEKIYAGKKESDHTIPQHEINQLLIEKAEQGKKVVRLKGGDPFIFGRGGEEAEELIKRDIQFRIVPGISSFYSAPAYAGIPLTHRDFANSFEVITGHRKDDSIVMEINFPEYKDQKTYVFLMGMKNLGYISSRLISDKGFPENMPAAVISWGTMPEQKVVTAPLSDIAEKARESCIKAPAIIVIGRVVSLRDKLRWFDRLPLFGKRIAVTRTREQTSLLSGKLNELGARVIEFPTIEIRKKDNPDELLNAVKNMKKYQWIIFTSQNAVNIFFNALKTYDKDSRHLHNVKVAAIGPATGKELQKYFIEPDLIPSEYVAEGIINEMKKKNIKNSSILVPCSSEARSALTDGLRDLGANVHRIDIYDTIIPENIPEDVIKDINKADMITFTSSSTVNNFFRIIKKTNSKLACIGPITAESVKKLGYDPDVTASEYTINGLVRAIEEYFSRRNPNE